MDITDLKEEELHPEAKGTLNTLRIFYVDRGREDGLRKLVDIHQWKLRFSIETPSVIAWHTLRAHEIALAECQLRIMIKGG